MLKACRLLKSVLESSTRAPRCSGCTLKREPDLPLQTLTLLNCSLSLSTSLLAAPLTLGGYHPCHSFCVILLFFTLWPILQTLVPDIWKKSSFESSEKSLFYFRKCQTFKIMASFWTSWSPDIKAETWFLCSGLYQPSLPGGSASTSHKPGLLGLTLMAQGQRRKKEKKKN